MSRRLWILTFGLAALASCGAPLRAGDTLPRGNQAFKEGRFEEAAKIYESEEEGSDLLTRRFNSGVSWARTGAAEKAIERFEDVSARADGELRASALYNAGHSAFGKGTALAATAESIQEPEEKTKKLAEAATAFRASTQFFRSVEPPDEATTRNIAAAKTALRAVLDEIARIEAEKRRKEEDDALKAPAELLRAIAEKERIHRGMSRALAKEEAQKVRLGSRRLRKSEAENRTLSEKLHRSLTAPPPAPQQPPPGASQPPHDPPGPSEEEKARNARAAEAIARAIDSQKEAEVAYGRLELQGAAASHTRAVAELRTAIEAFPLDVATVIGEAVRRQEALNGAMESLAKAAAGGMAPETAGEGMGKKIVDAIKDKVLLPLAKLIAPRNLEDAKALSDDEDDVVWCAGIISQAEIQAPPPAEPGAPGQPGMPPAPGQHPSLTPEQAKELSEKLRAEGKTAHDESSKCKETLASGDASGAVPRGREALEALKRAADLLPKPPKPPEERLRELIERQKGARQAVEGMRALPDASRAPARLELEKTQRSDGKEAEGIAGELEAGASSPVAGTQQDPRREDAIKKIREGEEKIFTSAELLSQAREDDSKAAIDRDIALLEEALALLQGKDHEKQKDKEGEQEKQEQDPKQDQNKKRESPEEKKKKEGDKPYALTPRDAQLKRREMDRKRREEEAKIFSGGSTLTVEKDW